MLRAILKASCVCVGGLCQSGILGLYIRPNLLLETEDEAEYQD